METDRPIPPDPLIDEYLALLKRWKLSEFEIGRREQIVRLFEARMLAKQRSVYETAPIDVQGHLYALIARSASVVCLRRHWIVLREYFDFLIRRGLFQKNPVTEKLWPYWGAELHLRPNPLAEMREASLKHLPPAWARKNRPSQISKKRL